MRSECVQSQDLPRSPQEEIEGATDPNMAEEPNILTSLDQIRDKIGNLLAQVNALVVTIGECKIILPTAYGAQIPEWTVIAIGCKSGWRIFPFPKRLRIHLVLYFRRDYFYTRAYQGERYGMSRTGVWNDYRLSRVTCLTEKELLGRLDKEGAWGAFLYQNEDLLQNINDSIRGLNGHNVHNINIEW